jgi:hypothetical protein
VAACRVSLIPADGTSKTKVRYIMTNAVEKFCKPINRPYLFILVKSRRLTLQIADSELNR